MYKSIFHKVVDKFLSHKKPEEVQFPIVLKEMEIPIQKSNFIKIKALLQQSVYREIIIDKAVERQIEEYLFFSKILFGQSMEEKTSKIDIEIFNSVMEGIFILSTSKDYERKADILFKLYVASARYVERNNLFNLNERPIDTLGGNYAIRGIHNGSIMFIHSVEEIELQEH